MSRKEFESLRTQFVNGLYRTIDCREVSCTEHNSCREFHLLLPDIGVTYSEQGHFEYETACRAKFKYLYGAIKGGELYSREEVLKVIGFLYIYDSIRNKSLFSGWLEIPELVGEVLHKEGWYDLLQQEQGEEINKRFLLALTRKALPDNWLNSAGTNIEDY